MEAERMETARQAAAGQMEARQEAARQEAARAEAERLQAQRQQAEQQAAAAQREAAQEAARREAARLEDARQAATRDDAARMQAAREVEERREAARRALGRQLDEEADRRDAAAKAARLPETLPYSLSSARRGRLFGRTDPNAELVLYAEAWARKIQLNTSADMFAEAVKRPHNDPLVIVALRRDGSVESVTFVLSSGVPDIDESIRRIVQSHVPYQAFPPGLARDYDVIEIRRTWYFDMAVRLY
jgi:outer membrane biosynthesis protein TonB